MENKLEPRLQQMLNAYGVTSIRDPKAARRNQERFVAILNIIFEEQLVTQPSMELHSLPTWSSSFNQLRERFANTIRRRSILVGLAVLIVLGMFLFGGMGITADAASSSLPGDALYSLKTTMENVQANLVIDSATDARLYMEFAGRRLLEIQSLIDEGRYTDIAQASTEFDRDVQRALSAIESLSLSDAAQSIALSEEIAAVLRSYGDILSQMLASLPGDVQPVVQSAINTAQSAASLLDIEDDDNDDPSGGSTIEPTSTAPSSSDLPAHTSTVSSIVLATDTAVSSPTSTAVIIILPTSTPEIAPVSSPTSSIVEGGDVTCEGLLGAVTVDNLYVPQGAACALDGTTVQGSIKIETSASLTARQITVFGNVQAEGANYIEVLSGSSVGGSIQIKLGGAARVEDTVVNGDIQFESNTGMLSIARNQVSGNVQVFKNAGGATIANNIINSNLQCKENAPAPAGGNNSVQGSKEDQCAGL